MQFILVTITLFMQWARAQPDGCNVVMDAIDCDTTSDCPDDLKCGTRLGDDNWVSLVEGTLCNPLCTCYCLEPEPSVSLVADDTEDSKKTADSMEPEDSKKTGKSSSSSKSKSSDSSSGKRKPKPIPWPTTTPCTHPNWTNVTSTTKYKHTQVWWAFDKKLGSIQHEGRDEANRERVEHEERDLELLVDNIWLFIVAVVLINLAVVGVWYWKKRGGKADEGHGVLVTDDERSATGERRESRFRMDRLKLLSVDH